MARILIIDDDTMLCDMVRRKLGNLSHTTVCAQTLKDGMAALTKADFDLILLDVRLPDGSGLEALPHFKTARSQPEIIIITGEGDPDGAQLAIETGAWDYIEKPLSMRDLTLQVTRALQYHHKKADCQSARLLKREGIVGASAKINACLEQVAQSASADTPILITGETGTGKELFARAVHTNSCRSAGPFVVLDCAAFPENLVESMLFGHRRGAFTGADQNRDGLILQAHQGTLFMDEVGELPPTVQKAFLRVLQERRFRPLGAGRELESDFRLVAATNRDLKSMVQHGQFRADLMFRLQAANIHIPPLAHRQEDIESLALHYISRFCKRYSMGVKGISPECMDILLAYEWPGNVRELVNVIDCAVANAQRHDMLFPMHLPANIRVSIKRQTMKRPGAVSNADMDADPSATLPSLRTSLEFTERRYFKTLMIQTLGDIRAACRIAGLSRSGLYARLKKYDIERPA